MGKNLDPRDALLFSQMTQRDAERLISNAVLYGCLRAALMIGLIGFAIRVAFMTVFG